MLIKCFLYFPANDGEPHAVVVVVDAPEAGIPEAAIPEASIPEPATPSTSQGKMSC